MLSLLDRIRIVSLPSCKNRIGYWVVYVFHLPCQFRCPKAEEVVEIVTKFISTVIKT